MTSSCAVRAFREVVACSLDSILTIIFQLGNTHGQSAEAGARQVRTHSLSEDRMIWGPDRAAIDTGPRRRGHRMKRRELMALLAGAAMAAARPLCAQQRAIPVIGFLSAGMPN